MAEKERLLSRTKEESLAHGTDPKEERSNVDPELANQQTIVVMPIPISNVINKEVKQESADPGPVSDPNPDPDPLAVVVPLPDPDHGVPNSDLDKAEAEVDYETNQKNEQFFKDESSNVVENPDINFNPDLDSNPEEMVVEPDPENLVYAMAADDSGPEEDDGEGGDIDAQDEQVVVHVDPDLLLLKHGQSDSESFTHSESFSYTSDHDQELCGGNRRRRRRRNFGLEEGEEDNPEIPYTPEEEEILRNAKAAMKRERDRIKQARYRQRRRASFGYEEAKEENRKKQARYRARKKAEWEQSLANLSEAEQAALKREENRMKQAAYRARRKREEMAEGTAEERKAENRAKQARYRAKKMAEDLIQVQEYASATGDFNLENIDAFEPWTEKQKRLQRERKAAQRANWSQEELEEFRRKDRERKANHRIRLIEMAAADGVGHSIFKNEPPAILTEAATHHHHSIFRPDPPKPRRTRKPKTEETLEERRRKDREKQAKYRASWSQEQLDEYRRKDREKKAARLKAKKAAAKAAEEEDWD